MQLPCLAVPLGVALAVLASAAPARAADPCVDEHPAGTDAPFVLRGRVATEKTLTASDLRAAVAAGTCHLVLLHRGHVQRRSTRNGRT